jgi:hypothetical protein
VDGVLFQARGGLWPREEGVEEAQALFLGEQREHIMLESVERLGRFRCRRGEGRLQNLPS